MKRLPVLCVPQLTSMPPGVILTPYFCTTMHTYRVLSICGTTRVVQKSKVGRRGPRIVSQKRLYPPAINSPTSCFTSILHAINISPLISPTQSLTSRIRNSSFSLTTTCPRYSPSQNPSRSKHL